MSGRRVGTYHQQRQPEKMRCTLTCDLPGWQNMVHMLLLLLSAAGTAGIGYV